MMITLIKRIMNRKSHDEETKRLLHYRDKYYNSNKIMRFIYIRKYNGILRNFAGDIPMETSIGKGLCLPHGANGVFISRGATIGEHCTIFQQVTIGTNTIKDSKGFGAPIIGNNVYIGAGAKIIGNVTVGENCRIGANAIIVKDIPDNSVVVMPEPRIIVKIGMNNLFEPFQPAGTNNNGE